MLLDNINKASDVKKIKASDLNKLAKEIRRFLIRKLSVTGGHLASNLGVVELTIALYRSFNIPEDKIIWDVGHQSYTHKILSGRKDAFDDLRRFGGISGFPKTKESPCDAFNTGHSSTSISAGLGIAQARDLMGKDYKVVSIIGDGALTGGMAYEALNNAARMKKNFIIVLNDNSMSISRNVGGMSNYLNGIRTANFYNNLKKNVQSTLEKLPLLGKPVIDSIKYTKNGIKQFLIPGMLFENMGIIYLGPVDGHNTMQLCKVLNEAKKLDLSVLVHVITRKGKGYRPAEENPEKFHGVGSFNIATGKPLKEKTKPDYTDVFADKLCELAKKDKRITAITAAMPDGTGLAKFGKIYPKRFFDVGIAEQHAVTLAAGMASAGLKPVAAIYSSFLQRGFDQVLHDVCIQNLNVVFAIDRAGLVGADGETHQGIFDLSYLSCIPNMSIMVPKNAVELEAQLEFALSYNGPIAVRYPRGQVYTGLEEFNAPIEYAKGEMIYEEEEIALLAAGSMVSCANNLRNRLKATAHKCSLANVRFIKPFDKELIDRLCKKHKLIVTLEENVLSGGFGIMAGRYISQNYPDVKVYNVTLPDAYVEHGDVSLLRQSLGIDSESIFKRLKERYGL